MGKTKRKRDTVFLGDEIGEYLKDLKVTGQGGTRKTTVQGAAKSSLNLLSLWKQIAPPRMLEHTDNVVYSTRSKETEVLVYVDTAVYATELTMDKELYRLRMQQELGKDISDIKFLVSRKTFLKKKG